MEPIIKIFLIALVTLAIMLILVGFWYIARKIIESYQDRKSDKEWAELYKSGELEASLKRVSGEIEQNFIKLVQNKGLLTKQIEDVKKMASESTDKGKREVLNSLIEKLEKVKTSLDSLTTKSDENEQK
jgi:DNA-binding ferritin-like protein